MATPSVIIDLEPNWNDPPEVGYSFETVIQGTPYFLQQRRPLIPTPKRSVNCKYLLDRQKLQYARNLFLYGASKLCCIPIYSEPIQSAAVTQGASAIVASTDTTYFWNIKNCDYIVLLDWITGISEMVAVASVSGQTINLSSAIVNSWTAAQTIIYPAIAGQISAIKGLEKTSIVGDVSAEFEEISLGEEATKVWVGFTDLVCPPDVPWIGYEDFTTWNHTPDAYMTVAKHEIYQNLTRVGSNINTVIFSQAGRLFNEFIIQYEWELVSMAPVFFDTNYSFLYTSKASPTNYIQIGIKCPSVGSYQIFLCLVTGSASYSYGIVHSTLPLKRTFRVQRTGTTVTLNIYSGAALEETLALTDAGLTHTDFETFYIATFLQSGTAGIGLYIRNMIIDPGV